MNLFVSYLVTSALLISSLLGFGSKTEGGQSPSIVSSPSSISWSDLSGRKYGIEDIRRSRATVFFFSSTQCPISNSYVSRMVDLAKEFQPRAVQFFLVNSNIEDSAAVVSKYAADREIPFPAVKDIGTELADRLVAHVTPEAFVLDSGGIVRYRGRIDDNRNRELVTRQDIRLALDAILSGNRVERTKSTAIGCAIFRDKKPSNVQRLAITAQTITYARDVAPILNQHCVSCHRPGEVAPFSLQNFDQARTWAPQIRDYTARHIMPPWKTVPGFGGEFVGARRLSDGEIRTLGEWADGGVHEGNRAELPRAVAFQAPDSWKLGNPDVVLKPTAPYYVNGEGTDIYRCFALPIDFKEDRYISGFELKPGNRAVVHHMICVIDPSGEIARQDGYEAQPGFPMRFEPLMLTAVWGDAWNPGSEPRLLPSGVAIKVPAGARIVLQIHYVPTGKVEIDESRVGLYWAKGPVEKLAKMLYVGPKAFTLDPGDPRIELRNSLTLSEDVQILSVFPHMHSLGREMQVAATVPGGVVKPLIKVTDFDANWQITYVYKEPVALPRGSKVNLTAIYDNSAGNPRQPSHPPRTVGFGMRSTDEMCFAYLIVTFDAERVSAQNLDVDR